jgi:hypothetical protein
MGYPLDGDDVMGWLRGLMARETEEVMREVTRDSRQAPRVAERVIRDRQGLSGGLYQYLRGQIVGGTDCSLCPETG